MEFGEQYKPFPKHWGVPPNTQMKGHDGVVRILPGGFGKGNFKELFKSVEDFEKSLEAA